MCFELPKGSSVRPSIARKNIIAFKLFKKITFIEAESPVKSFRWTTGKVEHSFLDAPDDREIYRGFHCCKTPQQARRLAQKWHDKYLVVGIVIIPKGAKYYQNATQYVSDTMQLLFPDINDVKKIAALL